MRHSVCVRPSLLLPLALALVAARAPSQEPLLRSPFVATNAGPVQLDVADVDGDGKPDLILLDAANKLSSQLGDGVGGFGAPVVQGLGAPDHTGLASADFDADGLADVVLTRAVLLQPDQIRLFLGVGDGSFEQVQIATLPDEAADVDALDLDADGDADLLAGSTGPGERLAIYRGDGAGHLAPKQDVQVPFFPQDLAEGDVDGDGHLDIVVTSEIAQSLGVLLADGAGGWADPLLHDAGFGMVDVQLGDVDADGDLDVVTGSDFYLGAVAYGDGEGGFSSQTNFILGNGVRHVALGDVDEDGLQDGVFAQTGDDQVSVVCFDQPLTYEVIRRFGTGDEPRDVELVDLNGDGDLDIAVGNGGFYDKTITLLPGNGDGWFTGTVGGLDNSIDVAFGDLDADGAPDLASVQATNWGPAAVTTWRNLGLGVFGPKIEQGGSTSMSGLDFVDFEGDGDDDLVASDLSAKLLFAFVSPGDGTLEPAVITSMPGYLIEIAAGDLDGDGLADVVAAEPALGGIGTPRVGVVTGQGDGTFDPPVQYDVEGDQQALLLRDVTGDGELDVIVGTYAGVPSIGVLAGLGDGTLADPVYSPSFVQQSALAGGDLDEDGDCDLVANSVANNAIITLRNDGGAAFSATALMSTLAGTPRGVEVADFDLDGHLDVCSSATTLDNAQTGSVAIFLGHGDGTLSSPVGVLTPRAAQGTAVADIDGDGAPDVGVASLMDQLGILLNASGPWQSLGYGLAGTQGVPRQIGEGTLVPGAPFAITLRDARPKSNAAHVLGLTTLHAPFKGGTFVPDPVLIDFPLPTDADGVVVLQGDWPGPAAPDLNLYMQFWIQDPQGPKGWAASGALQATLP